MDYEVKKLEVGYLKENTYIFRIDDKAMIVDPGSDPKKIIKEVGNLDLVGILVTHRHFDHIGALEEIKSLYNVDVYDYKNVEEKGYTNSVFEFDIIFTPGHTTDSIVFYFKKQNIMFTGDFLFKGNIGRCDLGGSVTDMNKSIEKIKKYPNCIVYPGHGESTTLFEEIKSNPYF